jgi:ubiquinone biosynthesis protein
MTQLETKRKPRRFNRYRQIAEVLARHGLWYIIDLLGLKRFVPFHQEVRQNQIWQSSRPEHVRLVLEELGTTFIKLGQLLSTRPDLIPADYLEELVKLQDQAPPIPFEAVQEIIETEFGRPVNELFATFEEVPLAAASIGQVHAATTRDGVEVVVKVRRPGVVEQVEEDLELLQNLAARASRHLEIAQQYDVVGLAQEFAQTLRAEMDYLREGHNAERFQANFADFPGVHIPRIFWKTTTSRVLTLERIHGVKINDLAALDAAKINRQALAERATKAILKMIFEDGFFHADLHPGNFFVEKGGRFGLIDFGMVGVVDEKTRSQLARLFVALTSQDSDRLVATLLELGVARKRLDHNQLSRDLRRLLSRYYDVSLGELVVEKLLQDALELVRRHNLQLPSNLIMLLKLIVMAEGLGKQLSPTFRLPQVLEPFAQRLILQEYSPLLVAKRFGQASLEMAQLGLEMPQQLRRLLSELERGSLEVGVYATESDSILRRLERLTNRVVLGIIVAAFIIGLAILLAAYRPAGWEQWAGSFFAIGFVFAAIIGTYLAWSILRSK